VLARFDDLFARGLRELINGDPSLEVLASDIEHTRVSGVLRAHHPDVAILDADSLWELTEVRELGDLYPATRLVLLAKDPSISICAPLLAFGASACLGRQTQARDVLNAIHLAARGLQLAPRAVAPADHQAAPGAQRLTPREAEVLIGLQQSRSNAEIALALGVGVETVRTHAHNLYRKLGVSSRRELRPQTRTPAGEPPMPPARQTLRDRPLSPHTRTRHAQRR
jgi:DNA-binding NarL/FixJ family response regulator